MTVHFCVPLSSTWLLATYVSLTDHKGTQRGSLGSGWPFVRYGFIDFCRWLCVLLCVIMVPLTCVHVCAWYSLQLYSCFSIPLSSFLSHYISLSSSIFPPLLLLVSDSLLRETILLFLTGGQLQWMTATNCNSQRQRQYWGVCWCSQSCWRPRACTKTRKRWWDSSYLS